MNNQKKVIKKSLIILSIIIVVFFVFTMVLAPLAGAGSYPYAQMYEVNSDEKSVIAVIEDLKRTDSSLIPPIKLTEGRDARDTNDYWYYMNFYFKQENQIVLFWTRPITDITTEIGLVSIKEGSKADTWMTINDDLSRKKNIGAKENFEKRILDKSGLNYTKEGNNMFVWWK